MKQKIKRALPVKEYSIKYSIILLFLFFVALSGGCAQELDFDATQINARAYAWPLAAATIETTETMKDNYAAYFTPDEFRLMIDDYNGSFAGIGIYLDLDEQGRALVVSAMPNRPAKAAGLESGDIIMVIDGEETFGMDLEMVMLRLRGVEGTDVNIDLLRERPQGDLYYSVTITRAIIESDSLTGEFLAKRPSIAYIEIYSFTERTPQEFEEKLAELRQEREIAGLILDLRNNGGGSFGAAMGLADFFISKGEPIVWEKTFEGERCYRSYAGTYHDLPVVCLQNEYTASASEVLIGALKDYGIAQVIGTVSFGKGITQIMDSRPDGSGVKYTRSRYFTPQKYDLHGKGIIPDIEIDLPEETTYEQYFDPNDPGNIHIQKALSELDKRIKVSVFMK